MTASITGSGGTFIIVWEAEQLSAYVERVYQHKDGKIDAEITIRTTAEGVPSYLAHARINLLTPQGRGTIAREAESRYSGPNWKDIVEELCVLTIRKHREGDPVEMIGDTADLTPPTYQLWPILLKGKPTTIWADGGSGKSALALYFAILIQRGINDNGLTAVQGNVLYCDWETDVEEQKYRAATIQIGSLFEEAADIRYRRCYASLADDVTALQKIVLEHNITYLIIDSLSGACGDDLRDQAVAARFHQAIASLRVGCLIITHTAKETADRKSPTQYGSAFWHNYTRSEFELKKSQEADESKINVALIHRKINSGKLMAPIGFTITFGENSTRIERQNVKGMGVFTTSLPMVEQMRIAITRKAMTPKDIAAATGINENTVRQYLRRYPKVFIGLPTGVYGLAAAGSWDDLPEEEFRP